MKTLADKYVDMQNARLGPISYTDSASSPELGGADDAFEIVVSRPGSRLRSFREQIRPLYEGNLAAILASYPGLEAFLDTRVSAAAHAQISNIIILLLGKIKRGIR